MQKFQKWRHTKMPYSKYRLGLRGLSSIMFLEIVTRQRTSSLEWALNMIPSRLTPLWKGSLSHLWYGRTRVEILVWNRSYPLAAEHNSDIIGGSGTKITPSTHVIMAVIAPWTEPFLAYLNRQELSDDQNEDRRIVRRSKAYKLHEGELYEKSTT